MEAFQVSWRVLQFASASIRANPKIIKLALQKDSVVQVAFPGSCGPTYP